MSRKKKQTYVDANASIGHSDMFGRLYVGMLKSPAFRRLNLSEKYFYCLCRVQAQSKEGKACLYQHGVESGETYNINDNYANDFVFPAKHLEEYGIDRSNANKLFKSLEQKGFIRVKEKNGHRYKVNVYSFSDGWKNTS